MNFSHLMLSAVASAVIMGVFLMNAVAFTSHRHRLEGLIVVIGRLMGRAGWK